MSYYPEPEGQSSRDKVKVVLDLSSYATKKQLEHSTAVDTSDLAVKKDFVALKAEIDKLDINKLVNVTTNLNNLKTKWFRCWWVKNCSCRLEKIKWSSGEWSCKKHKIQHSETKVNKLDKKNPAATTLIHNNQCNTDNQNLKKKNWGMLIKKPRNEQFSNTTTVLNTKISKVKNKMPVNKSTILGITFNKN